MGKDSEVAEIWREKAKETNTSIRHAYDVKRLKSHLRRYFDRASLGRNAIRHMKMSFNPSNKL